MFFGPGEVCLPSSALFFRARPLKYVTPHAHAAIRAQTRTHVRVCTPTRRWVLCRHTPVTTAHLRTVPCTCYEHGQG
jgi:hypothetical protein